LPVTDTDTKKVVTKNLVCCSATFLLTNDNAMIMMAPQSEKQSHTRDLFETE